MKVLILLLFIAIFTAVKAQDNFTEYKILSSDGDYGDHFGLAVSCDGDVIIAGAPYYEEGAVYIFNKTVNGWSESQKLIPYPNSSFANFGFSAKISNNFIIVGAPGDFTNNLEAGAVYVFEKEDTIWSVKQKILASDREMFDDFGNCVASSSNLIIIGAENKNTNGEFSGAAYIFEKVGDEWFEQQRIVGNEVSAGDIFGHSVAICNDYAIVGAPFADENGYNSGTVYIFKKDSLGWNQLQKINPSDPEDYMQFGCSVSVIDDYAIIGARGNEYNSTCRGAVYVFRNESENWIQVQKLLASDGEACDEFGFSVSIKGDKLIIGAHEDTYPGVKSGSAYVFERIGEAWIENSKFFASDMPAYQQFGFSVDIEEEYIVVGAPFDDQNGSLSGAVYVYTDYLLEMENRNKILPQKSRIIQNYPNPFNPSTTIRYEIPEQSFVTIKIYDILGNEIATLVNEEKPAGGYVVDFSAQGLSSGIYFYSLSSGNFLYTKKMILLK